MRKELTPEQRELVRNVVQNYLLGNVVTDIQGGATKVQRAVNRLAADVLFDATLPDVVPDAVPTTLSFDETISALHSLIYDAQKALNILSEFRAADYTETSAAYVARRDSNK